MFNWQEYYVLARKLLSQADSLPHDEAPQKEAMLRSAGSRAYYAAYHRACDYLRKAKRYPTDQEIKTGGQGSHQVIIDIFMQTDPQAEAQ